MDALVSRFAAFGAPAASPHYRDFSHGLRTIADPCRAVTRLRGCHLPTFMNAGPPAIAAFQIPGRSPVRWKDQEVSSACRRRECFAIIPNLPRFCGSSRRPRAKSPRTLNRVSAACRKACEKKPHCYEMRRTPSSLRHIRDACSTRYRDTYGPSSPDATVGQIECGAASGPIPIPARFTPRTLRNRFPSVRCAPTRTSASLPRTAAHIQNFVEAAIGKNTRSAAGHHQYAFTMLPRNRGGKFRSG